MKPTSKIIPAKSQKNLSRWKFVIQVGTVKFYSEGKIEGTLGPRRFNPTLKPPTSCWAKSLDRQQSNGPPGARCTAQMPDKSSNGGVTFFRTSQYDNTPQYFQQAVQSNLQDSEAQFDLGKVLFVLGIPPKPSNNFKIEAGF